MTSKQKIKVGDGCGIAYRFDGPEDAAPILLLSNSLGTDMDMWVPQIAEWSEHFRVLRYDSRGHGASDSPPGAYSIGRLGYDVVELLDALGLDVVYFCGLSLGGMVGQWLAVHAPERIKRLVLANTSCYMGPPSNWQARIERVLADGMAPLAEASISRWFTPAFAERNPLIVSPIRDMLLATNPAGYAGCCAAIRDMDHRPIVALIRTPTLVIAGKEDPATPLADALYLYERLEKGTIAKLDAAHLSNVEDAENFGRTVKTFLDA